MEEFKGPAWKEEIEDLRRQPRHPRSPPLRDAGKPKLTLAAMRARLADKRKSA